MLQAWERERHIRAIVHQLENDCRRSKNQFGCKYQKKGDGKMHRYDADRRIVGITGFYDVSHYNGPALLGRVRP